MIVGLSTAMFFMKKMVKREQLKWRSTSPLNVLRKDQLFKEFFEGLVLPKNIGPAYASFLDKHPGSISFRTFKRYVHDYAERGCLVIKSIKNPGCWTTKILKKDFERLKGNGQSKIEGKV